MLNTDAANGWVRVARETFERSMVPWVGRKYEPWLRAWARPHPVDPGQVLIPGQVYRVYAAHRLTEPATRWQLDEMGYPALPPSGHADPVAQGPPHVAADMVRRSPRSLPSAA